MPARGFQAMEDDDGESSASARRSRSLASLACCFGGTRRRGRVKTTTTTNEDERAAVAWDGRGVASVDGPSTSDSSRAPDRERDEERDANEKEPGGEGDGGDASVSVDRALRVELARETAAVADVSVSKDLNDIEAQIRASAKLLSKKRLAAKGDADGVREALAKSFIFANLERRAVDAMVSKMYSILVSAGTALTEEGHVGDAMYIVQSGEFSAFQTRMGTEIKIQTLVKGDMIGELGLLTRAKRMMTVRANRKSRVWVCTRQTFKSESKHSVEETELTKNVFLEKAPIIGDFPIETRKAIASVMEFVEFDPFTSIMCENDACDGNFYIIVSGRADVSRLDPDTSEERTVHHLFRYDFFGEAETLMGMGVRKFTVRSVEDALTCYRIGREDFTALVAPMGDKLLAEKSREVIRERMHRLKGGESWRMANIRLLGTARVGGKQLNISTTGKVNPRTFETLRNGQMADVELVEKELLGGGTGGEVYRVLQNGTISRMFALKRARKLAVMENSSHIFHEKEVTSEISHFSLMCQHACFQDNHHLYMLFDIMDGCDLMDMLANMARVKTIPAEIDGMMQNVRMQMGLSEDVARYYVAMIILAFEYLHSNQIIYRDLKPENVLVAMDGRCKLGDFGYSRKLDVGERAFTFCGTPGYVAPEIVLSKGYGYAVDWWALGVLTFVIITSQQPFSFSKDPLNKEDPMVVMRRIVDMSFSVEYPPYASETVCHFISQLLRRDASKRLGNIAGGVSQLKNHPWFEEFDWSLLESGEYKPKPLALTPQFMELQRERLASLKRESLLATEMDSSRKLTDVSMTRANEIFKNF